MIDSELADRHINKVAQTNRQITTNIHANVNKDAKGVGVERKRDIEP